MKCLASAVAVVCLAGMSSSDVIAKGKQAPQPDMCTVPPGAQPLLPAKLLPGMGITKAFPVTTSSEDARKFFNADANLPQVQQLRTSTAAQP